MQDELPDVVALADRVKVKPTMLRMRECQGMSAHSTTMPGASPAVEVTTTCGLPATVVAVRVATVVADQSANRYAQRYAPRMAGRITGMSEAVLLSVVMTGAEV
jgi:hypothetical protein